MRKINEAELPKADLRKLNALRKSVGPQIANNAFTEWVRANAGGQDDRNIEVLSDAIEAAIKQHKLTFPRGGYLVRRGRGRVIVEPAQGTSRRV